MEASKQGKPEKRTHRNIRWLKEIEESDRAKEILKYEDTEGRNRAVFGRNWTDACSDHAVDMFKGIDAMDPADPARADVIKQAKAIFVGHFGNHIKVEEV